MVKGDNKFRMVGNDGNALGKEVELREHVGVDIEPKRVRMRKQKSALMSIKL